MILALVWWLGMCCTAFVLAWLRDRDDLKPLPSMSFPLVVLWPLGLPLLVGIAAFGREQGEDLLP